MIKKYEEYIKEFYTGRYSAAGIKFSDPSDKFDFNINIEANPDNYRILREILLKYNIAYDDIKITPEENLKDDGEKVNIKFLSYNKYEASSIIDSIISELIKKKIPIDIGTITLEPINAKEKRKIGFQ
jgi:hypothetical protein